MDNFFITSHPNNFWGVASRSTAPKKFPKGASCFPRRGVGDILSVTSESRETCCFSILLESSLDEKPTSCKRSRRFQQVNIHYLKGEGERGGGAQG